MLILVLYPNLLNVSLGIKIISYKLLYDSQYRMLAFFNLGATMIQHKDCMEKGNQYLKKGLKSCTDDFFAVKYKEVLFVYEILKENVGDAKKLIRELDDSK